MTDLRAVVSEHVDTLPEFEEGENDGELITSTIIRSAFNSKEEYVNSIAAGLDNLIRTYHPILETELPMDEAVPNSAEKDQEGV